MSVQITGEQARLIRDCVTEVMLRRQRLGAPIPQRVRDLLAYVSASGHQSATGGTESNRDDDLIDTDTAAAILGCSRRHARRLAADLEGTRVGREWIFRRQAVTEYAEERDTWQRQTKS